MAGARIARIALRNLDSLASRPAIAALFAALPGRIGLVVASRRYGGKYGGFWRQTARNWRRSGRAFVDYLGLNYVWHRPLAVLLGEDAVQKGGFAGAQEACEHGYGDGFSHGA